MQLQVPPACTVAVQIVGPLGPSLTAIVLPGSPVPLKVGVVFEMGVLPDGDVSVGATGATVSTVNGCVVVGLVLPAASVALADTVCSPSASASVGVQLQFALESATAVHTGTPPSVTLTVLSGSAVPPIGGRF